MDFTDENQQMPGSYPKPKAIGGRLIRDVVGFLKSQKINLPIDSHILIATSGGSDSVGLAHLLIHFGRRVVDKKKITLLHINHGWRAEASLEDELFVQNLGQRWDVPVVIHRLSPPGPTQKESWEELARNARKTIFRQEAQKRGALVFTGHQADDLAETLLWRLFTGTSQTHGGGIIFSHGVEMRPFLQIRKKVIESYLKEMAESFRFDSTNDSDRFLRSRMRKHLMPEVERIFPRAVDHLVDLAICAQKEKREREIAEVTEEPLGARVSQSKKTSGEEAAVNTAAASEIAARPWEFLFRAAGINARRAHFDSILEKWVVRGNQVVNSDLKNPTIEFGELCLPGGWRLTREKNKIRSSTDTPWVERWVLELESKPNLE